MAQRKRNWIIAGLAVMGLLIAGVGGWIIYAAGSLGRQLDALCAQGHPVSIADLARTAIAPQENAEDYLRRAKADILAAQSELSSVIDVAFDEQRLLEPDEAAMVRKSIAARPELVPLLRQAANCRGFDSHLDYSLDTQPFMSALLANADLHRAAARVLYLHTLAEAAEGKRDEAIEDVTTIFKLSRHFEREPCIVGYQIAQAVRQMGVLAASIVLQSGEISPATRQQLDQELAWHEATAPFKRSLETERAYGLNSFQSLGALNFALRLRSQFDAGHYLESLETEIAASEQPYWQYTKQPAGANPPLVNLWLPVVVRHHASHARSLAQVRSLRVLNALQALPSEVQSTAGISGLKLPADATLDPFTSKPLQVKKQPTGWKVYSLGENLVDDGGDFTKDADVGVGPSEPAPRKSPPDGEAGENDPAGDDDPAAGN